MFLYILDLKIINIYKYINLFQIHSGTRNTSVQIRFDFGSPKIKILNNSDI